MKLHKLPSVKLVMQKIRKEDTEGYLYLRCGIPGVKRYVLKALNHKIPVKDWDSAEEIVKKAYREAGRVNALILKDKDTITAILDTDYKDGVIFTEQHIRNRLFGDSPKHSNFLTFYRAYIDNLIATNKKAHGTIQMWETEYGQLKKFVNSDTLPFRDITTDFLNRYHEHIAGYKPTTIFKKLKKLRQIIKNAVDRELISKKQIAGFEMIKYQQPDKHYLNLEQIEHIATHVYSGKFDNNLNLRTVAAYFVVACYSGLRYSDWSRFTVEKLVKGRSLKVRTVKNKEPIYIPLNKFKRLAKMIGYIEKNKIVFDYSEPVTNRLLKDVEIITAMPIKLHTHLGRHSCATMLGEMGYSAYAISQILGITETTAKIYRKATRQGLEREYDLLGGL